MYSNRGPEVIELSSSEDEDEVSEIPVAPPPKSKPNPHQDQTSSASEYRIRAPSKGSKKTTEQTTSTRIRKVGKVTAAAAAEEKELKKANQQREKELKVANQQREKQLRKLESELKRNTKPGEAYKFMIVLLDPNLAQKGALETILEAAGISHSDNVNVVLENSFLFERESVYQAMGEDLQLHKLSKFEQENQILILLEPDEVVPKIVAQMALDESKRRLGDTDRVDEGDEIDLTTYIESIKATFPNKAITLLLFGMDNYFKKMKKNEQQEFRVRVLNAGNNDQDAPSKKQPRKRAPKNSIPVITRYDFQSALIQLQLSTGLNYRLVNSVKELGHMLVQYTKAIADAPFKRAQREATDFDWYALADTAGSVKVEKDGEGLGKLWLEQLKQFNHVGQDTAATIVRKYPTPADLVEAYQACCTQEEGQALLRELPVQSGYGPLQKTRKLGPELSKKLYRFFTSTDPERSLS